MTGFGEAQEVREDAEGAGKGCWTAWDGSLRARQAVHKQGLLDVGGKGTSPSLGQTGRRTVLKAAVGIGVVLSLANLLTKLWFQGLALWSAVLSRLLGEHEAVV